MKLRLLVAGLSLLALAQVVKDPEFRRALKRLFFSDPDRPVIRVRNGSVKVIAEHGSFTAVPSKTDEWDHAHTGKKKPEEFVVIVRGANEPCWAGCAKKLTVAYRTSGNKEAKCSLENEKKGTDFFIRVKAKGKLVPTLGHPTLELDDAVALTWVQFGSSKVTFDNPKTAGVDVYFVSPV